MYDDIYSIIEAVTSTTGSIISLLLSIVFLVAMWQLFKKADCPGWGCLIPVYNLYCLAKIAYGNGWIGLLALIPGINVIFLIITWFNVARKFGKGVLFSICTVIFTPICLLILAYGGSEYNG